MPLNNDSLFHPDTPAGYLSQALHELYDDYRDQLPCSEYIELKDKLNNLDVLIAHLSRGDKPSAYKLIKKMKFK